MVKLSITTDQGYCTPWTKWFKRGCAGGKNFTILHDSMDFSETETCEKLCLNQGVKGCCNLADNVCSWKSGGTSTLSNGSTKAVNCAPKGIFVHRYIIELNLNANNS